MRVNRATGETEPWLAERWTTSPDGRTITLTLRDGVTFSDGAPFTSADVLFTFQALYDPSSQLAGVGRLGRAQPLQVSAPTRTVVVTLPAPFAPGVGCSITCRFFPSTCSKRRSPRTFGRRGGRRRARAMAGLGPFVIAEYLPRQRMTFTRNPRYWRKDASDPAPVPRPHRHEFVPAGRTRRCCASRPVKWT